MKYIYLIFSVFMIFSCNNQSKVSDSESEQTAAGINSTFSSFGKEIDTTNSISVDELKNKMVDVGEMPSIKVKGVIEEVCQKKGCWMTIKVNENETMRVSFKDYAFFVPKDIAGKTVFFEGIATKDTTSVEELKHYAKDEGLSQEEIDKINSPEIGLTFEAEGVLVMNN